MTDRDAWRIKLPMYEETLLTLSRDTRFRLPEAPRDPVSFRRNPACGDEIALVADFSGGRVDRIRFHAQGCAVSVAAAAALCLELQGLDLDTARDRLHTALAFFSGDGPWSADWGSPSLPALGAVRARPMRMACVRLAWEALRDALESA